jgi:hypothetical protein
MFNSILCVVLLEIKSLLQWVKEVVREGAELVGLMLNFDVGHLYP